MNMMASKKIKRGVTAADLLEKPLCYRPVQPARSGVEEAGIQTTKAYRSSRRITPDQYLANPTHLLRLRCGVTEWNQWRMAHPDERPGFNGKSLMGAKLGRANLHGANLFRTNFSTADLHEADLSGANLNQAVLCRTNLSGADLRHADLGGAFLYGADLCGADLTGAWLFGAILNEADLRGAVYEKSQLNGVTFFKAKLDNS